MAKRVGILALQGDFEAHARMVEQAGAEPVFVRTAADLDRIDGLIVPGGESTTMLKLIGEEKLTRPLADFAQRRPVFGTCAGAILAAAEVSSPEQFSFGWMDIGVERNAYGRQIESRVTTAEPAGEFSTRTSPGEIEAVFIRAPIIRRIGPKVKVLATYGGDPVLVEDGRHMAATFHPELTADSRVHQLFLSKL